MYFLYTGELKLASQMQAEETEASVPKLKKFRQKKREVQCAVNLALKLQPFIDSNENAEVRWLQYLCAVSWGVVCSIRRINSMLSRLI